MKTLINIIIFILSVTLLTSCSANMMKEETKTKVKRFVKKITCEQICTKICREKKHYPTEQIY